MALSFANKVTVIRIVMIPFFIMAVIYYTPQREYFRYLSFGLFLLAVVTDIIDGYIARTRHQKTKAGSILDPLADKMLLISAFICLYMTSDQWGQVHFPLWFVLAIISRDVVLLIGSMLIYVMHGDLLITPSRWGKTATFFQILSVIGIFLQWIFSFLIWYIAVLLTLISGVDYIRHGIRVLNSPTGKVQ